VSFTVKRLHPLFVGECKDIVLRETFDHQALADMRAAMDEYAVMVFRNQPFSDGEQMAFAKRLDGELHAKTGSRVLSKNRLGTEAVADISNVGEKNDLLKVADRRRQYALGNRLWHTDASFQDPAGRYSMLSARVVPPVRADTEFADMRAAYDALSQEQKDRLHNLTVHHSIAHSREKLGFSFSAEEMEKLKGAIHPLVRSIPRSDRRSLYLASHAAEVMEMPVPDGRLLLADLMEHATQREFVYCHQWREGDLVIWDNRATMHRGKPFDDTQYRREMRRVTTLDLPTVQAGEVGSAAE
jgi:alpha-ketoglutarate-dependent 2,4-dichlorophenoxyacetate dioxygenase